ncbi:JmjC domain-containing protein [Rhodopirellula baltica]|uniref:Cupin 4 family protein n=1 Tax=Rhodopirellula baltica SWK14 TaxID=993516 RepID=L7CFT1_RHOBT|nr:cupin domain-containing protein [Rhodopirellula baltica]ELP32878.1 Cupin 4 family protein [Rhodopirellula baltica SWK14]
MPTIASLFDMSSSKRSSHFLEEEFERKPVVFRSDVQSSPIVFINDVDKVLADFHLPYPFVRVVRDHETLRHPSDLPLMALSRQCLMDRTAWYVESVAAGCSLLIQAMNRRLTCVRHICNQIEKASGLLCQANGYLTPRGSQTFNLHFDTHDVFVWQQEGSKAWKVFGSEVDNPSYHHRFQVDEKRREQLVEEGPIIDTTLTPGDMLYIPRGYLHCGQATADDSFHLTVGVFRKSHLDYVSEFFGAQSDNPEAMKFFEENADKLSLDLIFNYVNDANS